MRELASQIKTKQREGFPTPFINIELNKFLPPIHPQHVAADVEGLKAKVRFMTHRRVAVTHWSCM